MSLLKGTINVDELYFTQEDGTILTLSELYYGELLIWQKEEDADSNLMSFDGLTLISEDGLILTSKDNG